MSFSVDKTILLDFVAEAEENLEKLSAQLVELEKKPQDENLLNEIFRHFHTIKGAASFFSLQHLVDICHAAENIFITLRNHEREMNASLMDVILQTLDAVHQILKKIKNDEMLPTPDMAVLQRLNMFAQPDPKSQDNKKNNSVENKNPSQKQEISSSGNTVRIEITRLDGLMNLVGELVLSRNRLMILKETLQNNELDNVIDNVDVLTSELQVSVMKMRMQPIQKTFSRFPRITRDLARSLKKDIRLELEGEQTDLDKNVVEALTDPLVHLIRNAIDHGIEAEDVRLAQGKPSVGCVTLSAQQAGDHITLSVRDDGAGIDPEVLRKKAAEHGFIDAIVAQQLSEKECFNLIFLPGFSTKMHASDISGRGMGMDVVKEKMKQLNGSVEVTSILGRGTQIHIKIPLTVAILGALKVVVGEQTFVLPLADVHEVFRYDLTKINVIDGQTMIFTPDRVLPIFYLKKWLAQNASTQEKHPGSHVVVVNTSTGLVGLVVDRLLGQEEVVIKPLGHILHDVIGVAGATILSDGKPAIILDVPGLLKRHAQREAEMNIPLLPTIETCEQ